MKTTENQTVLEQSIRAAQVAASKSGAQDWEYGQPAVMQKMIDNGQIWHLEGSAGRAAMEALESGCCFLPETISYDAYGNKIPPRTILKSGTKGTLENSARFWKID